MSVTVSMITDVLNAEDTIEETILSVLGQTYKDIEYTIIDGQSIDGTLDVIKRYKDNIAKVVSEPDKNHFDAMNKGIRLSSGDIIGFLHADDFFASKRTIESVVNMFENKKVDCVWGDMVYIDKRNSGKIIRYWKSCSYKNNLFLKGWMPSHPSFFVKKKIYEKYGYFNIDMEISADYELMLRFLHKYGISGEYIPEVLVKMRLGGLSNGNFRNIIRKTLEDLKAWEMNGLKGKIPAIFLKNISKIPQFFIRQ